MLSCQGSAFACSGAGGAVGSARRRRRRRLALREVDRDIAVERLAHAGGGRDDGGVLALGTDRDRVCRHTQPDELGAHGVRPPGRQLLVVGGGAGPVGAADQRDPRRAGAQERLRRLLHHLAPVRRQVGPVPGEEHPVATGLGALRHGRGGDHPLRRLGQRAGRCQRQQGCGEEQLAHVVVSSLGRARRYLYWKSSRPVSRYAASSITPPVRSLCNLVSA